MGVKGLLWSVVVGLFVVFAVAGPVLMLTEDDGGAETTTATGTVKMAGLRFSPDTAVVAQGTEVVFTNDDVAPHTVTEPSGDVESGLLNPGDEFRLVVDEALDYVCSVHPAMQARVEIEEG
ncbi:MAG: copper-binding protein [Actinomycetota bacterium]|nr:copper-binding protein [Actinomycetota bacterium]